MLVSTLIAKIGIGPFFSFAFVPRRFRRGLKNAVEFIWHISKDSHGGLQRLRLNRTTLPSMDNRLGALGRGFFELDRYLEPYVFFWKVT
jgi:hypothetical protein